MPARTSNPTVPRTTDLRAAAIRLLALQAELSAIAQMLSQRVSFPIGGNELVPLKTAERQNYTYETIRHWCAAGKVQAEKRGGKWFVARSSLSEYIAARR
jgi:hypothetical protein